jgi:hypothetical protein
MGKPNCLTVVKTSIAIASGEGRASLGSLQFSLSFEHSEHMQQLSMYKRKALS